MTPAKSALRGPWPSEIRTSWSSAQLRRVVRFRNGADYKTVEVPTGGYPVFGSGGEFRRASSYLYEGPSVLFGRKGTVDRPLLVDERFWTVDTMFYTEIGPRLDPRYLHYYATTMPFRYYATNTAVPSMTQSDLGSHVIPLPAIEEQRVIADFLDRETARIDTLIAKQGQLIATLRERRRAVIDGVVTQGLDPTVMRRDSGTPWIGEIPSHWKVKPLWSMFRRIKDVDHPEEQMLSVFRDFGVVPKESRANINKTAENRAIYQLVHPGWLVTNRMKAWQGSVGISSLRGIVSGHYICFAPTHSENATYLNWLFRAPRYAAGYAYISRGVRVGQAEIDNSDYRVVPVVLPPADEQVAIVAFLEDQAAKIDALIDRAEQFIDLSKERRSALITAAVTGQIDVRREVA